jgi:hypothetical protein
MVHPRLAAAVMFAAACGEPERNPPAPIGGTEAVGPLSAAGGQGEATASPDTDGTSDGTASGATSATATTATTITGTDTSDDTFGTFGTFATTLPGTESASDASAGDTGSAETGLPDSGLPDPSGAT